MTGTPRRVWFYVKLYLNMTINLVLFLPMPVCIKLHNSEWLFSESAVLQLYSNFIFGKLKMRMPAPRFYFFPFNITFS